MKIYKCYNCPNRVEIDTFPNMIMWGCSKVHNRGVMDITDGVVGKYPSIKPFWCPREDKIDLE